MSDAVCILSFPVITIKGNSFTGGKKRKALEFQQYIFSCFLYLHAIIKIIQWDNIQRKLRLSWRQNSKSFSQRVQARGLSCSEFESNKEEIKYTYLLHFIFQRWFVPHYQTSPVTFLCSDFPVLFFCGLLKSSSSSQATKSLWVSHSG